MRAGVMAQERTEEPSEASAIVGTLHVSAEEFKRARERVGHPQWAPAVDGLRKAAERAFADRQPLPEMDIAWYDADPERDFAETYVPFHAFIRPATDLLEKARTLVYAGVVLGDRRYLERAGEWLLYVSGRVRYHVRHHDSGMEYGRLSVPMAEVYTALRGELPAEACDQIHERLERAAEAIQWGTEHWLDRLQRMPYSNHLAFHRHGLLAIGLVLGRADLIEVAIDGPRGFGDMLAGATYDDGLCYESSTHYHFATFGALLGMAEMVRHRPDLNRDLYRESFANGRDLKQMFDAPLGLLLPNAALPPVGDCYARRGPFAERHAKVYEIGYAVYSDPKYAWVLSQCRRESRNALLYGVEEIPEGSAPGGTTRLWPEHGYSLLTAAERAEYWSPDNRAPAAFLSADRNGIHHHLDRLGLQVAGAGRLWLEDVESATVASEGHGFVAPIQKGFNRTTLAHNLVMVDQENQRASEAMLELREFKDLPGFKTITWVDPHGILYEGVVQARSVAVTADYLLDVVQVVGDDRERTCDLLLHPRADGPVEIGDLNFGPGPSLADEPPYAVLREVESANLGAGPSRVDLLWRQSDAACAVSVSVMEGQAQEVIRASWPVQSDWADGGREMLILRAVGKRVSFVSLYQIRNKDAGADRDWRVASAERIFNGKQDEIRIRTTDGSRQCSHVLEGVGRGDPDSRRSAEGGGSRFASLTGTSLRSAEDGGSRFASLSGTSLRSAEEDGQTVGRSDC